MNLWRQLWADESGTVISAEAAMVGTAGVIAAGAGMSAVSQSSDGELDEVAYSIRSLNQSFHYKGMRGYGAWTAGSSYCQPSVARSRAELQNSLDAQRAEAEGLSLKEYRKKHKITAPVVPDDDEDCLDPCGNDHHDDAEHARSKGDHDEERRDDDRDEGRMERDDDGDKDSDREESRKQRDDDDDDRDEARMRRDEEERDDNEDRKRSRDRDDDDRD